MSLIRGFNAEKSLLFTALAVLFLLLPGAFAQETTAGLQGTLKDTSGGVIAKATVEVTSPALIGNKKVETDQGGYFRFANLPEGTYTVTVTATGFRSYSRISSCWWDTCRRSKSRWPWVV